MTVVGIGASSGVTAEELLAAIDAVLPPRATDVRLATLDVKVYYLEMLAHAGRTVPPPGTA